MIEFKIDSEEKVRKLINLLDNDKLTNKTKEALNNLNNLSTDDELFIVSMIVSLAIKGTIPEDYYKDIIIKADYSEPDSDRECVFGEQNKENGKYVSTLYLHNYEEMKSGDIIGFYRSLVTFGHELYHCRQQLNSENRVLDIPTLLYCLELVLKDKVEHYYEDFYERLYFETEAEAAGFIVANEFCDTFKLSEKYDILDKIKQGYLSIVRPNFNNFKDSNYREKYIKTLIRKIEDYKLIDLEILSKYPMLRFIFDSDGKLQSESHFEKLIDVSSGNEAKEEREKLCKLLIDISKDFNKTSTKK